MTKRAILAWVPLMAAVLLGACGAMGAAVISTVDGGYSFQGKKIALCVILAPEEQRALDDQRIVRRSLSDAPTGGYAEDNVAQPVGSDIGRIVLPEQVRSLDQSLEQAVHNPEFLALLEDTTAGILRGKGFDVSVVHVEAGEVDLRALADSATARGCDILAVETASLVMSWNVKRSDPAMSSEDWGGTFSWETMAGGLVFVNASLIDIPTGKVVWQHARRAVPDGWLAVVIGELYRDTEANRSPDSPGDYQAWLYRQSMGPSLQLAFASGEPHFVPLPSGYASAEAPVADVSPGDAVFVRSPHRNRIWHYATVRAVTDEGVEVTWPDGTWRSYTSRTTISPSDVIPAQWPSVVWVRKRSELVYTPYRFVRVSPDGLVHTFHAGDLDTKTFTLGRVGVVPY